MKKKYMLAVKISICQDAYTERITNTYKKLLLV